MAKVKQEKSVDEKATSPKSIVSESVGNYEKHPFFIKKANQAKEVLNKVGLPKSKAKK